LITLLTHKAGCSILAGFGGTFVNVHITVGPSIPRVTGTNVATIYVLHGKEARKSEREREREGARRKEGTGMSMDYIFIII